MANKGETRPPAHTEVRTPARHRQDTAAPPPPKYPTTSGLRSSARVAVRAPSAVGHPDTPLAPGRGFEPRTSGPKPPILPIRRPGIAGPRHLVSFRPPCRGYRARGPGRRKSRVWCGMRHSGSGATDHMKPEIVAENPAEYGDMGRTSRGSLLGEPYPTPGHATCQTYGAVGYVGVGKLPRGHR